MITDWYFYLAAIPAVILMGFSKGGFSGLSILSTPVVALIVGPVRAAAIMLPILVVQDFVSMWAYRRSCAWNILAFMLPGSLIGIFIGWLVAAEVSDLLIGAIVGFVAVGFVVLALIKARRRGALKQETFLPPSPAPALFWGTGAGFTSFVSHQGGPMFQIYVLPRGLSPELFAGTSTFFFAITNLVKLVPYAALGQFSRANLETSAVLFPLAAVATLAGVWLVRRVSPEKFYSIVYSLTMLVGLKLIFDWVVVLTRG